MARPAARVLVRETPWYVVVLAMCYVAMVWVKTGVSPYPLARPMAIAALVSVGLMCLFWLVVRDSFRVGLLATVLLIALAANPQSLLYGALAASAVVLLWRPSRSVPHRTRTAVRKTMNAVAIIATLAVTFQAAGAGLLRGAGQALADQFMPRTARAVMPADPSLPDIFVVLLDGYPRADILETVFGFDNSPFLRALEGRGFAVSVRSHANYMSTNLTLASMFDMRPLSEIDGLELSPTDEVQNDRTLHAVLNGARGLTSLRQVGYRVETVSTGLEFATLREADQSIESSGLSLLELRLLTDSGMSLVLDAVNPAWVLQQHRDRVEAAFAEVRPRSRESQGPTFRLVHILSPHPPIVLGDDLDLTSIEYTLSGPARDDPVAMRRFVHQVRAANDLTLAATDRLRSDDRPPVIIVMSDHGSETAGRTGRWMFKDPGERVANLFAASTPGVGRLFGPAMTPVNLLPILLNHYAGLELQTWPDESYRWTGNEFERMGEGDSETS